MPASGRPEPGEYGGYAEADVAFVVGDDIVEVLGRQIQQTLALLSSVDDARAGSPATSCTTRGS